MSDTVGYALLFGLGILAAGFWTLRAKKLGHSGKSCALDFLIGGVHYAVLFIVIQWLLENVFRDFLRALLRRFPDATVVVGVMVLSALLTIGLGFLLVGPPEAGRSNSEETS